MEELYKNPKKTKRKGEIVRTEKWIINGERKTKSNSAGTNLGKGRSIQEERRSI